MILAMLSSLMLTFLAPRIASAHCPGTFPPGGRQHASGVDAVPASTAVRALIGYTNPAVCSNGVAGSAFTLEGVNLRSNDCIGGWVQTGWIKRRALTAPR